MDCGQVLSTLRAHEAELREAGISELSLFGSTGMSQMRHSQRDWQGFRDSALRFVEPDCAVRPALLRNG